jgi:hypothetical protein
MVGLLAYQLAIKETFLLKAKYKQAQLQETHIKQLPILLAQYKKQKHQLDSFFIVDQDISNVRNHILNFTEDFCDTVELELIHFNEIKQDQKEDLTIIYSTICLKGDFVSQLRYYHYMEQNERSNKLVSLKFHLKKEKYKQRRFLYSEGLIQSIIPNE